MLKHIYIDAPLSAGTTVKLPRELERRLTRVMRFKVGHELAVFNGVDGLFLATLADGGALRVESVLSGQPDVSERVLYICVPKKETFSRVLRQATELGVSDIYPLFSDHTVPDKLNLERCGAILIEAAEQCERLTLPTLHAPQELRDIVFAAPVLWAAEREDMSGGNFSSSQTFLEVLVGPEGGFSAAEVEALAAQEQVVPLRLGDTILRTDTAVVAALTKLLD